MPTRRAASSNLSTVAPQVDSGPPPDAPVIGAPNWGVPVTRDAALHDDLSDDFEDDETPADRVASMLEDARGAERATVKLFRVLGPTKYAWCEDFSIEDFEAGGFAMIRDRWGPGEYEIRLYAIRPQDGRFGVRGKPRVTIEATAKPAAAMNPAPSVDPAVREMLAQMAATQNRMLEVLAQRPDPSAQMMQTITMMGALREAMGMNVAQPAQKSSISEVVEAVRELRAVSDEINPRRDEPESDPSDPMAMLPKMLDLVGKLAGQPNAQAAAQPQAFPPVMLPASMAAGPAHAAPSSDGEAVSLPATNPAPAAQAGNHQPEPTDDEMGALELILMRGYLGRLCAMSTAGDVEAAAEFAFSKLPDEAFEILEMPTWFDALAQFYPPAANHREWLSKVRDRVNAMANEDGAP